MLLRSAVVLCTMRTRLLWLERVGGEVVSLLLCLQGREQLRLKCGVLYQGL
jgi:hypothetical protein